LAKRLTRVEILPPYGVDPPPASANFSPERQRIFIAVLAQCGSMHTLRTYCWLDGKKANRISADDGKTGQQFGC
jgi:hypothetical protein